MTTTATFDHPSTDPSANPTAAKLVIARPNAILLLRAQLEQGMEIKATRIRYADDLNAARARKLAWTQTTIDLLNRIFDNGSVADFCNDWVGKIFPEYAELGNFVESFYDEMEYRTSRVLAVVQKLEEAEAANPTPMAGAIAAQMNMTMNGTPVMPEIGHPMQPPPTAVAPQGQAPVASAPIAALVPVAGQTTHARPKPISQPTQGRALLVVQGAQDHTAAGVADFLKQLGVFVVPTRMGEPRPNLADTLARQEGIAFVAVLLDDTGAAQGDAPPRDDRALLFELGFCAGKLGAHRVCVMHTSPVGAVEASLPHLVVEPSGAWQLQLAKHLRKAGIDVDLNKLAY